MMDKKDFENFDKFVEEQKKVLIEKGENEYKTTSFKDADVDDLFEEMFAQFDKFDFDETSNGRQRACLHIANYAFFLYEKTKV